jgi:hypothetical protein
MKGGANYQAGVFHTLKGNYLLQGRRCTLLHPAFGPFCGRYQEVMNYRRLAARRRLKLDPFGRFSQRYNSCLRLPKRPIK